MARRPNEFLIEGVLNNTVPGKVTGWMRFLGMKRKVVFNLDGNFHRDIRGATVKLTNDIKGVSEEEAKNRMKGFCYSQRGNVGDMTAGKEPADYTKYPYFEWYGKKNGRIVLELDPEQVEILTPPIPACESDPIDRGEQSHLFAGFLTGLLKDLNKNPSKKNKK